MPLTIAQTVALAGLEQQHDSVQTIPDDWFAARLILPECVSDTRLFLCPGCELLFSIEPDGSALTWILILRDEAVAPESWPPD